MFGGDKALVGGRFLALFRHPIVGFLVLSCGYAGVTLYVWYQSEFGDCLIAPMVTFLDGDYEQWTLGVGTGMFVVLPALVFLSKRVFRCYYSAIRVILACIVTVGVGVTAGLLFHRLVGSQVLLGLGLFAPATVLALLFCYTIWSENDYQVDPFPPLPKPTPPTQWEDKQPNYLRVQHSLAKGEQVRISGSTNQHTDSAFMPPDSPLPDRPLH